MRAPWLADVLDTAGLTVHEIDGWKGRGRDMAPIYGVVVHDTVTLPSRSPAQDDRLIRDGHSRVPGPLYQLGVDRQGVVRLNADGRCNHNGHGTWGNNAIGIGVYCNGGGDPPEPWNEMQRATVVAACRAILIRLDLGPSAYWNPRVAGHKETDPDRKVDPYRIDMDALRTDVEDDMSWLSKWPTWARPAATRYATKDTKPNKRWGRITIAERLAWQERFDAERRRNG